MMTDDDTEDSAEPALSDEVKNFLQATKPFLSRLSVAKKALRILGGASSITKPAVRAWAARCQRWQTQDLVQEAEILARATGLPTPVVLRNLAQQRNNDLMMLSALRQIGGDPSASHGDPADPVRSKDLSTPDGWFHALSQEVTTADEGFGREAFARILAGEIQNPGSFSVRTLKILGSLSQSSATIFRGAASVSIRQHLTREKIWDARIPAVGGKLGQNCLQAEGLAYYDLIDMTENGLLHPDYDCQHPYESSGFTYQDVRWTLAPKGTLKAVEIQVMVPSSLPAGLNCSRLLISKIGHRSLANSPSISHNWGMPWSGCIHDLYRCTGYHSRLRHPN